MEKQPPATGATTISSSRAIAATMFMAVVASSFLLFLPVLIGGLSGFGLTSSQISVIAAADLGGISLCSLAAAYWINRVSWQHAALVGLLLIIAGNVACYWVQDFSGLAMLRFAVGIGEGVLMPINLACLARTKVPDRNFGIFIVLQTIHAMIGLALIPYLVAFSGVGATFILMAGLALVVLPMLRWLPDSLANSKNDTDIEQTTTALRLNGKALLTLGAIFFFFAVQSGIWTYIERIGDAAGISAETIGTRPCCRGVRRTDWCADCRGDREQIWARDTSHFDRRASGGRDRTDARSSTNCRFFSRFGPVSVFLEFRHPLPDGSHVARGSRWWLRGVGDSRYRNRIYGWATPWCSTDGARWHKRISLYRGTALRR
jgi:hypothetical protein